MPAHSFKFGVWVPLALAGIAHAHIAAFHRAMYCVNGTDPAANPNNNAAPVQPLYDLPYSEFWMHHSNGCDDYPPEPGVFLELDAGGNFTVELAGNRADTSLNPLAHLTDWGDGQDHPDDYIGNPCIFEPNLHTQNQSMAAGTAWAISYESDIKKVTPNNLVVFSVLYHTPWKRLATYQVPSGMPACPDEGCICTWLWIPNGCGLANMYMFPYRCKVNPDSSPKTIGEPQPPVWCEEDESTCVKGPKQMLIWHQADSNNINVNGTDLHGDHKSPAYNMKCGFQNGPQLDIFVGSGNSSTLNASNPTTSNANTAGPATSTDLSAYSASGTPGAPSDPQSSGSVAPTDLNLLTRSGTPAVPPSTSAPGFPSRSGAPSSSTGPYIPNGSGGVPSSPAPSFPSRSGAPSSPFPSFSRSGSATPSADPNLPSSHGTMPSYSNSNFPASSGAPSSLLQAPSFLPSGSATPSADPYLSNGSGGVSSYSKSNFLAASSGASSLPLPSLASGSVTPSAGPYSSGSVPSFPASGFPASSGAPSAPFPSFLPSGSATPSTNPNSPSGSNGVPSFSAPSFASSGVPPSPFPSFLPSGSATPSVDPNSPSGTNGVPSYSNSNFPTASSGASYLPLPSLASGSATPSADLYGSGSASSGFPASSGAPSAPLPSILPSGSATPSTDPNLPSGSSGVPSFPAPSFASSGSPSSPFSSFLPGGSATPSADPNLPNGSGGVPSYSNSDFPASSGAPTDPNAKYWSYPPTEPCTSTATPSTTAGTRRSTHSKRMLREKRGKF